jgi:hypothetical protein
LAVSFDFGFDFESGAAFDLDADLVAAEERAGTTSFEMG